MSYCRFSTDDFQCDLYCYEDVSGGWTTHVAANRVTLPADMPPPPSLPFDDSLEARTLWAHRLAERNSAVSKIISECPRVSIGLPHDGQTFNDPTIADFLDRLIYLRGIGYKFPDQVLADVRQEIQDNDEASGLLMPRRKD